MTIILSVFLELAIMKRTDNKTLSDLNDAPDLQRLVHDKRSHKRATTAKASRRNRRYENRILSAHTEDEFNDEEEIIMSEDSPGLE
jgi:hypothetical protein